MSLANGSLPIFHSPRLPPASLRFTNEYASKAVCLPWRRLLTRYAHKYLPSYRSCPLFGYFHSSHSSKSLAKESKLFRTPTRPSWLNGKPRHGSVSHISRKQNSLLRPWSRINEYLFTLLAQVTKCSHELRSLRTLSTCCPDSSVSALGISRNMTPSHKTTKRATKLVLFNVLCPRLDLNQHARKGATTSR
jgi:hypothetical protein